MSSLKADSLGAVLLEGCLEIGLGALLVGEHLAVLGALGGGVGHEGLVVLLGVLLGELGLGHLLVQVLDQEIDHRDDAVALLALLLELLWCLGGRAGVGLGEHGHSGACNATWSFSWCQGAASSEGGTVLIGELTLWRGLVELWVVELVQAVLGELQELLCGGVACHEGGVVRSLLLALLGCLSDGLVQGTDAIAKGINLLLQSEDALLGICNGLLQVRDSALSCLLLVLSLVKLSLAVFLLAFIINLLLLQLSGEIIDELDDLLEAGLLALHCQGNEIKLGVPGSLLGSAQQSKSLVGHVLLGNLLLQEAGGTWQSLLEELKGIVIVEDLDGVLQGSEFLATHLHVLIEELLLLGAVLLQVLDELLVLQESLTGVAEVVLHLDNF